MTVSKFQKERDDLQRQNDEIKAFLSGLQGQGDAFSGLASLLAGIAAQSIENQTALYDQREAVENEPPPIRAIWDIAETGVPGLDGASVEGAYNAGNDPSNIMRAFFAQHQQRFDAEQASNVTSDEAQAATAERTNALKRRIAAEQMPFATSRDVDEAIANESNPVNTIFK